MRRPRRRLRVLVGALVLAASVAFVASAGPPDPRQMSGIPRVDPQVPAGTVTVRVLDGSFENPVVGQLVELVLETAEGTSEKREATTVEQGRATFDGLVPGMTATASTVFHDGETVRSQAMVLDGSAGTRVMLVRGGGGGGAGAQPQGHGGQPQGHGGGGMHGGADVPMPGRAFALEGRPPGTIVVGVLDLEQMRAIPGVEVRLVVTAPGVEPKTHTLAADDEGRATFSDLGELPEGATLVAEATLPASEGESEGETKRSEPFELKDKALAVILARGVLPQGHAETPPTPQGPQVRQLPGPRRDESLGEREVVVEVFDSADARVSGIEVELVRQDMTGAVAIVRANTNARGIATFENVADPEGGLFFAGVVYKGAPFDSPTFQLPAEVGARVALRVWPTTKDARRVRSAVQLDFEPRENDLVQITQEYMVLVEGDAAFWAPNFEITGAADAVGLQVLGHSGEYLEKAEEDSPVAQLARPIPPGEEVRLSVAYLVSHRGVAEVTAELPFPIVQGAITVPKGMPVLEGKQGAAQPQEDGQGPIDVYQFTPTSSYTPALCDVLAAGGGPCPRIFGQGIHEVRVVVGDLPHTNPWFVRAGWIVVATLLLALGTVLVLIPRVGIRRSLLEQRDALREAITRHRRTPDADEAELSRLLEALDGVLRRLDALDAGTEVS